MFCTDRETSGSLETPIAAVTEKCYASHSALAGENLIILIGVNLLKQLNQYHIIPLLKFIGQNLKYIYSMMASLN